MSDAEWPIRIDYDDHLDDVINKVNHELQRLGLRIEYDGKPHDGYELCRIVAEAKEIG